MGEGCCWRRAERVVVSPGAGNLGPLDNVRRKSPLQSQNQLGVSLLGSSPELCFVIGWQEDVGGGGVGIEALFGSKITP